MSFSTMYQLGVKEVKVQEITRLGTGNESRPILVKRNDAQAQVMYLVGRSVYSLLP